MLALGLGACSPEPVDPTADCSGDGASPPGEPGSAEVLLTVGNDDGSSQLTGVLYADGWVLTLDGVDHGAVTALHAPMRAPTPPAARQWQPAYLGSCQLDAVRELAADELAADLDLGDVPITDQARTVVTYYGGEQPSTATAYALGSEDGSDLSTDEAAGREVLKGIIAALQKAPADGELLGVETVQLIAHGEVELPPDWPGPPLADIIPADDFCGELTGEQARAVFDFVAGGGGDLDALRLEVLPPGLPACA